MYSVHSNGRRRGDSFSPVTSNPDRLPSCGYRLPSPWILVMKIIDAAENPYYSRRSPGDPYDYMARDYSTQDSDVRSGMAEHVPILNSLC